MGGGAVEKNVLPFVTLSFMYKSWLRLVVLKRGAHNMCPLRNHLQMLFATKGEFEVRSMSRMEGIEGLP